MLKLNPVVGFHTNLTDHVMKIILDCVAGNYTIGQVARMSKTPKETLRRWLRRGEKEANEGIDSVFSQLWVNFEHNRGIEIYSMLEDVRQRKSNWQACWELLRTVAREDFGVEAVEYKELIELYEQLRESFNKFVNKQGVIESKETKQ